MESRDHLAHLAADVDRLAALDPGSLGGAVASCPGWDGTQLLEHLGGVHRWAMAWLDAQDPAAFPAFPEPSGRSGPGLVSWVAAGGNELVARLADEGPTRPCGSFLGPATVGWWARRQAIETAIHRWDAERIAGTPAPVPTDLAVDAVDEWFELAAARGRPGPPGSVHLHATDGDGEWFVEPGDPPNWTREHRKGDVAARGAASDLLLVLWGRLDVAVVDVVGRTEVLDRFLASS